VECGGDRFHGPEQWREDMRRQRVLERVGWRFWRCFASSFYRVMADLFDTLARMGIESLPKHEIGTPGSRFTEHRIIEADTAFRSDTQAGPVPESEPLAASADAGVRDGVVVGDRIIVLFSDDQRRISLLLTDSTHDLEKGLLSTASPLGSAVTGGKKATKLNLNKKTESGERL